jgi:hypothetical protein
MVTKENYVALSAFVYNDVRGQDNLLAVPPGWTEILSDNNPGFTASAFQNGSDIVIAFKGSDAIGLTQSALVDWVGTNISAGLGWGTSQLINAAMFYEAVKATYPGANITFTGHSLGGGLASLMAAYFDKPATTFDAQLLGTEPN